MSRRFVLAFALFAAASAASHGTAQAAPSDGGRCGLVATTDPGLEQTRTGVLHSGAIAGSGTLACTVQVDQATHNGPNAATAWASGSGVVVLPPAPVSFGATDESAVYLCTEWADADGTTWYWDATSTAWSTGSHAACAPATTASAGDAIPADVSALVSDTTMLLDGAACSVTGGDTEVGGVIGHDCPPYDEDPAARACIVRYRTFAILVCDWDIIFIPLLGP